MNRFHIVLRIAIGGIFAYAGFVKLIDPASFAADIDHYRIIPYYAVAPIALVVPPLEIACGGALLLVFLYRGALFSILVLATIFTAAVGSAWMRGLDISCGCFGAADTTDLPHAFARDILMLAGIGWLMWARRRNTSTVTRASKT